MKTHIINTSIIFIITCLVSYLFGCFANADFNISNWEGHNRAFIGFFGLVFSVFISGFVWINK